jgi:hypothetical protein
MKFFPLSSEQQMSKLDRDSTYRITALQCAVDRAGQDGGIQGDAVDVYGLAESYYAWLKGEKDTDTQKPEAEITRASKEG